MKPSLYFKRRIHRLRSTSKYTRLHLKQNHLAISKEEYIDLDQHQLNSCLKLHTDYLCPNLRLTASTHVLSCAASVFQSTPDDNSDM